MQKVSTTVRSFASQMDLGSGIDLAETGTEGSGVWGRGSGVWGLLGILKISIQNNNFNESEYLDKIIS